MAKQISDRTAAAQMCDFTSCMEGAYSVQHLGPISIPGYVHPLRLVDLPASTCTCVNWQDEKFPCVHAICAAIHDGKRLDELFEWNRFFVGHFRDTYSVKFLPWSTTATLHQDTTVHPPQLERVPERIGKRGLNPGPKPKDKRMIAKNAFRNFTEGDLAEDNDVPEAEATTSVGSGLREVRRTGDGLFAHTRRARRGASQHLYEVERLYAKRWVNIKVFYLVQWVGYRELTWEPASHIPVRIKMQFERESIDFIWVHQSTRGRRRICRRQPSRRTRSLNAFYLVHGWEARFTLKAMTTSLRQGSGKQTDALKWRREVNRQHKFALKMAQTYQAHEKARRAQEHNESLSRRKRAAIPRTARGEPSAGTSNDQSGGTDATNEAPKSLFEPGHRVWLYMERVKPGLTKKLAHRLKPVNEYGDRPKTRLAPDITENSRLDFDEELLPEDSWEPDNLAGEYEVEAILDDRTSMSTSTERAVREFKVKWVGYDDPTWEPASNLSCGGLLYDYLRRKRRDHRFQMVQVADED
ncbi:unnamed protein product [Phytophthora lilii]|uniref:Unnamed protein product n=1 Tax=Phytophthora lilii TaxID=2077276 RepID=A0A9W6WSB7_9STRA|nr:unnamed protein product [Phytophthora lilii]